MIIKLFLNKIHISKYTYLIIILSCLTGLIKELIIIGTLVIFHELGHFITSYIFKWNIKKISIYPFGGIISYDEKIDMPLIEELLITISGPLNQLLTFFILYILYKLYFITDNYFNIICNYNYVILIFNLLPIVPLDGSKLLNILLNKIYSFKNSYLLTILISIIFLILFINYFNNYSYYLIITFLIYNIYNYIRNKDLIFNKFILERYLYKNNYKKYYKINNIKKMKRNKKNLIKKNNIYLTEKEYIKKEYNS